MKLTTAYIQKVAKKDPRFEKVEIWSEDHQVIVWLDPKWTWCANSENVNCMIYNVKASRGRRRDNVATFLEHIKWIELAQ